ncbi:hypothetical protein Mapa_002495 [Marchantia paleacea]|nr:hypothetical protein Mapa_002495 [Marchantia paleacea]
MLYKSNIQRFAEICSNMHQPILTLLLRLERGFTVLDINRTKTDSNSAFFACSPGSGSLTVASILQHANLMMMHVDLKILLTSTMSSR